MKTKTEIINDINRALEIVDDEILYYGYTLDITTKTDEEYINNNISISKNRYTNNLCPHQEYLRINKIKK